MKKTLRVFNIGARLRCCPVLPSQCKPASDYSVAFSFTGPDAGSPTVYAVWIEDEKWKQYPEYLCLR